MAKDNITLLNNISNQLKKLNQDNMRQQILEREYRERQENMTAGGLSETEVGPNFIDAAEDFKRRVKGSITGAIASEKFTASGERARRSNKEAKDRKKWDKKTNVKIKDRSVGLSDIVKADNFQTDLLNYISLDTNKMESNIMRIGELLYTALLSKGNNRGFIYVMDVTAAANAEMEQKRWATEDKQRLDDKRTSLELGRESNKEKVIKTATPLALPSPPSMASPGFGSIFKKIAGLPLVLIGWAISGLVAVVTDFMTGFDQDGLAGGVGKALGGSGEGIWNAIKQSFKVGGVGAAIGLAIGGLFGGIGAIPGAIIGGLIGMAIGAVAGYFGGDRITAGLKDAGKAIADAWTFSKGVVVDIAKAIGLWFYSPGGAWSPGGTVKTKIFGGFISWDPGEFSIAAAWTSAKKSLATWATNIGLWFWDETNGTILGGTFDMPDWMISIKDSISKLWDGLKNFATTIKNTIIGFMPKWFTDRMGWTVNGKIPSEVNIINPNDETSKTDGMSDLYGMGDDAYKGYDKDLNSLSEQRNKINKISDDKLIAMATAIAAQRNKINKISDDKLIAMATAIKTKAETIARNAESLEVSTYSVNKDLIKTSAGQEKSILDLISEGKIRSQEKLLKEWSPALPPGVTNNVNNSQNTGAVVIQNIYSSDTPYGHQGLVNIHDHMDANQTAFKNYNTY